jgi:replication initiation protein RepC
MEPHLATTPFGRRSLTLAHVASQAVVKTRPLDKAVHKWNVFRAICAAKGRVGVSERSLAVLDALLTFYPETVLTGEDLIVFPSNQQLCLRAHGMASATLRRHLSALVEGGLIIRRDSPNGKRYARKDGAGAIEQAFGFDLSPLVVRAEQFEIWAEEVRAEERALKRVRERISLCRRDIVKMIATGIEEAVPTGRGAGWIEIHALYRGLIARLPRTATRLQLEPIADELALLADEILMLLETQVKPKDSSGNESQTERHIQNSNPDSLIELEPRFPASVGAGALPGTKPSRGPEGSFPLGMVLEACPDLIDYAKGGARPSFRPPTSDGRAGGGAGGIGNWRDFLATIAVVRPMLGISPSAWEEARAVWGEIPAGIVVAAILQRGEAINSAGGYIRGLTRKAEAGEFALGPMLMALIGSRKREKRRA